MGLGLGCVACVAFARHLASNQNNRQALLYQRVETSEVLLTRRCHFSWLNTRAFPSFRLIHFARPTKVKKSKTFAKQAEAEEAETDDDDDDDEDADN